MTAPAKITPAMHRWCRAISDRTYCRLIKRLVDGRKDWPHYTIEGQKLAKPSWAMVQRLEEAGLITWDRRSQPHEFIASLTTAGRAQAEIEDEFKAPPLTTWPFPVSAHQEGAT
jgi:hypothetical protein